MTAPLVHASACVCRDIELAGSLENTKRHKSCLRRSRKHFLPLECSPNFLSAQYLDIRTAESWTNCFITFSKLSMQLPYIFIIIACTQSSTRQCLREYVSLPHSYLFVLKLRESLIKSLKITVNKILNPHSGAGKVLVHQKIIFERNNFAKNDFHTS